MRYFVSYNPYSDWINNVCMLVGETKEYYKIKNTSRSACEYMIRKSNFMLRGSDIQFYELTEEEVVRKLKRQKIINKLSKMNFKQLTDSQLERIWKIVEEK